MSILVFILFIWCVIPAVVNYYLAVRKNRNWIGWIILAVFFGWISTVVLAILTRKDKPVQY